MHACRGPCLKTITIMALLTLLTNVQDMQAYWLVCTHHSVCESVVYWEGFQCLAKCRSSIKYALHAMYAYMPCCKACSCPCLCTHIQVDLHVSISQNDELHLFNVLMLCLQVANAEEQSACASKTSGPGWCQTGLKAFAATLKAPASADVLIVLPMLWQV